MEKKDRLKEENARIPLLTEETEHLNEKVHELNYQLDQARKRNNNLKEERAEAIKKLAQCENDTISFAQKLDLLQEEHMAFEKKHESCSAEKGNLNQVVYFNRK